jgi:superfamily II DNA or RNA helicase
MKCDNKDCKKKAHWILDEKFLCPKHYEEYKKEHKKEIKIQAGFVY